MNPLDEALEAALVSARKLVGADEFNTMLHRAGETISDWGLVWPPPDVTIAPTSFITSNTTSTGIRITIQMPELLIGPLTCQHGRTNGACPHCLGIGSCGS
jgi:hypothetical protein